EPDTEYDPAIAGRSPAALSSTTETDNTRPKASAESSRAASFSRSRATSPVASNAIGRSDLSATTRRAGLPGDGSSANRMGTAMKEAIATNVARCDRTRFMIELEQWEAGKK